MLRTSSEFAARAANDASPMCHAFGVLFFVAVGMLFDPRSLTQVPMVIAVVLFVVIVVKPMAALSPFPLLQFGGEGGVRGLNGKRLDAFVSACALPLHLAVRRGDLPVAHDAEENRRHHDYSHYE
jgi:hypothetical protein